jgi:sterol desaturase/sphingolipid hydroxylase (fatty acid hydroxylase superfamily)
VVAAAITLLLAPPLAATIAVDALILAAAFWTHAAVRLPPRLSAGLETLIVTPRLHLVHHSRDAADHDRNFGDTFVLWDRLFGTFKPGRDEAVSAGLDGEDDAARSLWRQLALPFRR